MVENPSDAHLAQIKVCLVISRPPAFYSFVQSHVFLSTFASIFENFNAVAAPFSVTFLDFFDVLNVLKLMVVESVKSDF